MNRVTFICCFNNKRQLEDMLMHSYNAHTNNAIANIILIDSKQNGYKSAAQAFNTTIKKEWTNIGDIIIFCHQDIAFDDTKFINRIIQELTNNPLQILGFAGITENGQVYSNLQYYKTKEFITRNRLNENKLEVASVDECCFATTKQVLQLIKFDENNCSHWHLYSVDLCYEARSINIPSYVISERIYHKEDGESGLYTDINFLKTMWKLTHKYHKKVKSIYTPCYICPTAPYKAFIKLLKTVIKNTIK